MVQLSIVIPTRNERDNLELLIPELLAALNGGAIEGEIIIVDSASEDGTVELVKKLRRKDKRISMVCEPTVGNLALAWKRGIEKARAELVAFMDADRVHSPTDLLVLFSRAAEGADMVIGNRYQTSGRKMSSKSIFNELFSQSGQVLVRLWLGLKLDDISHGFRVFSKSKYLLIEELMTSSGNSFLVEMAYHFLRAGFDVRESPVGYGSREYGEDKLKIFRESKRFVRLLINLRLKFGRISQSD